MLRILCLTTLLMSLALTASLQAALPKEIRQELSTMTDEARTVSGLVKKKQFDEAREIVDRLTQRAIDLKIAEDERDRAWKRFVTQLERARLAVPVSFEREIAPILSENCLGCHGTDNPRANLRLDTFAGLQRGGRNGALLIPRNSAASLIFLRLTAANPEQRMPRNADALKEQQLNMIARWIAGGAIFDGNDTNAAIGSSTVEPPKPREPVNVVMADGSETASFRHDVAPWMVNICLRCHQGDDPRGGWSITTFEDLLRDGSTGGTITPGDADGSYIWQVVGRQDPIKMPPGDLLLKRSQARALRTWINEGAHFDGPDPKAPLRSLVPTDEEKEAARMTAMTDEEFAAYRSEQAAALWKRAAPHEPAESITTNNLLVYGSVPKDRLQQVADWGEAQLATIRDQYESPDVQPFWKGRLIVFICGSRFDYEEFNTVLLDRRTPPTMSGHVVITDQQAEAYAVLADDGSTPVPGSMNVEQQLRSLISQSWLQRDGTAFPDWLREGFGRVAAGLDNESVAHLKQRARGAIAVAGLTTPAQLFDNGRFGPAESEAIGTLLTRWLLAKGKNDFSKFLGSVSSVSDAARAVEETWKQPADAVAQAFILPLTQ